MKSTTFVAGLGLLVLMVPQLVVAAPGHVLLRIWPDRRSHMGNRHNGQWRTADIGPQRRVGRWQNHEGRYEKQ